MPLTLHTAASFGIYLRAAVDDDLPFLRRLYASTREQEVAQTGWPAELQQAFLLQQHDAQHAHYRAAFADAERSIIEADGEPIGRIYWYEGPADFHIVDIALLPGSRGRGIGSAILQDLQAQAGLSGKGVTIHVEKMNPAKMLYMRLGFVPVDDRGLYELLRSAPHGPVS